MNGTTVVGPGEFSVGSCEPALPELKGSRVSGGRVGCLVKRCGVFKPDLPAVPSNSQVNSPLFAFPSPPLAKLHPLTNSTYRSSSAGLWKLLPIVETRNSVAFPSRLSLADMHSQRRGSLPANAFLNLYSSFSTPHLVYVPSTLGIHSRPGVFISTSDSSSMALLAAHQTYRMTDIAVARLNVAAAQTSSLRTSYAT